MMLRNGSDRLQDTAQPGEKRPPSGLGKRVLSLFVGSQYCPLLRVAYLERRDRELGIRACDVRVPGEEGEQILYPRFPRCLP